MGAGLGVISMVASSNVGPDRTTIRRPGQNGNPVRMEVEGPLVELGCGRMLTEPQSMHGILHDGYGHSRVLHCHRKDTAAYLQAWHCYAGALQSG